MILASNSFGNIFRVTTWGESHGKAIGVVIDGCPAGIELTIEDINRALDLRAPGRNNFTSPRAEPDLAEIYSGVFENKTTGAPISIIIHNKDFDSTKYQSNKDLYKPGHANYSYLKKYGIFDHNGGGRASARETACRVAAAAVAQKILDKFNITACGYIKAINNINISFNPSNPKKYQDFNRLQNAINNSPLFCPDSYAEKLMQDKIISAKEQGDSLGGVVELVVTGLPVGLGDPVYEKLEANLARAMLSIPASKSFEIGEGINSALMTGSEHNDLFTTNDNSQQYAIKNKSQLEASEPRPSGSGSNNQPMATNHAGGTLGGISTGMDVIIRVAFKPTSSIKKPQNTVDIYNQPQVFKLPEGSRHDPCVAIRAVPVVKAMGILVIADLILMNKVVNYAQL